MNNDLRKLGDESLAELRNTLRRALRFRSDRATAAAVRAALGNVEDEITRRKCYYRQLARPIIRVGR